jgi:hypothetical protein
MKKTPFLLIGLVAGVVLDRVVQANQSDPFLTGPTTIQTHPTRN